jgi:hypothetical protein
MKSRFAWFALALSVVPCIVGCGGQESAKPEDPAQIEEIRQKQLENSNREMSTSQ